MYVLNEADVNQSKPVTDIADELKILDFEIAKNPDCVKLLEKRYKLLEDLYDRVRSERVISAAKLRQFRTTCEDCMRCDANLWSC